MNGTIVEVKQEDRCVRRNCIELVNGSQAFVDKLCF